MIHGARCEIRLESGNVIDSTTSFTRLSSSPTSRPQSARSRLFSPRTIPVSPSNVPMSPTESFVQGIVPRIESVEDSGQTAVASPRISTKDYGAPSLSLDHRFSPIMKKYLLKQITEERKAKALDICPRIVMFAATVAILGVFVYVNESSSFFRPSDDGGRMKGFTELTIEAQDCIVNVLPSLTDVTRAVFLQDFHGDRFMLDPVKPFLLIPGLGPERRAEETGYCRLDLYTGMLSSLTIRANTTSITFFRPSDTNAKFQINNLIITADASVVVIDSLKLDLLLVDVNGSVTVTNTILIEGFNKSLGITRPTAQGPVRPALPSTQHCIAAQSRLVFNQTFWGEVGKF